MQRLILRTSQIGMQSLILLIVALCLLPFLVPTQYYLHISIIIFLNIIWSSTYRLILRTGQLHFGHNGFIGLGAYCSAALAMNTGASFWLAMLLAGVVGIIFAIILGYPSLRVKAVYFAIITWGSSEVLRFVYMRMKNPFGGPFGLHNIPGPVNISIPFLGLTIDWSTTVPYYFLALVLVLITLLMLYRLENSRFGLIFNAIREKDILASAVGVNIMRYKVFVFAIGGFFSSVGGALYAHYTTTITPYDFSVSLCVYLGSYVLAGGLNSFAGPIVGTAFLIMASEVFAGYGFYKMMIYSGVIVVVILFFPNGIVAVPKRLLSALKQQRIRASGER